MEDITKKLEKVTVSKQQKVLYYSVNFNYNDVMNLVCKTFGGQNMANVCTKSHDSFDLFDGKITEDVKKSLETKFSAQIAKFKESENFIVRDDTLYTANTEFHITTLFTGGKTHEKSDLMESEVGKKVSVKVNKLGVSANFVTLGVESIKFEDGTDISYFGNDVKHITIALNKMGKKVFPKDSYTALADGKTYEVDYIIDGTTSKVNQ